MPKIDWNERGEFRYQANGFCVICERDTTFEALRKEELKEAWFPHWFRDALRCPNCQSLPRQRAVFTVLSSLYPDWREARIHECSPGMGGASRRLRMECAGYTATQYDPGIGFGNSSPAGYRSENLQAQTFGDETFDIVVTQDVFEHLMQPDRAAREIARTLRPGGAHIFTVPLANGKKKSSRRAVMIDGALVHVAEPQYHGNPMADDGSLVTIDWGEDIMDYIAFHSGGAMSMYYIDDITRGLRAAYNEVFVCRKAAPLPEL